MSEHHKKKTRAVESVDQVRRSRPPQHTQELRQTRESSGPEKGRDTRPGEATHKADGPQDSRRADEPRRPVVRQRDNDAFVKSQDLVDEESSRRGSAKGGDQDVSQTLLQGLLGREVAERRAREGREGEGPTLLRSRREPKQPEPKARLFGANDPDAAASAQALRARETRESKPADAQGRHAEPHGRADEGQKGAESRPANRPDGAPTSPSNRSLGTPAQPANPTVGAQPGAASRTDGAQARDPRQGQEPRGADAASGPRKTEKSTDLSPGKDPKLPKAPGLEGAERRRVEKWYNDLSPKDQKWYGEYVKKQKPENREEALSYARRIDDKGVKDPQERRQLRRQALDELMKSELRPEQQSHLGKIVLTDENPTRKRQALERNGFGTKPGEGSPAPGSKPGETLDQLTQRPGGFNTKNNSLFLSTALLPKNGPQETLKETVRHELGHLRADEALTGNAPQSRDQQLQFGLELNRNFSEKVRTPEARAQAEKQLTNLYRPHTSSPQEAREKAAHALENRDEYYASLRSLRELKQDNPAQARALRQFDPSTSTLMRREERGTLRTDEQFLKRTNVDQLSQRYGLPKGDLEQFRGYQDDPAKRARLETYLTRQTGTTTGSYQAGTFASGGSTVPRERNANANPTGRRDQRVTLASHDTSGTTQRAGSTRPVAGHDGNDKAPRTTPPRTDRPARNDDHPEGPRRVRNDDDEDRATRPRPRPPTGGGSNDGGGTGGSTGTGGGATAPPPRRPADDDAPAPGGSGGSTSGTGGSTSGTGGSTSGTGGTGTGYNSGYNSGYSSSYSSYDYSSSYSSMGSSFPGMSDSMSSFGTLGDFLSATGMSMSDLQEMLPPGMDVANLDLNSDGKITKSDISLLQQLQQQYGSSTPGGGWSQMSSLLGQISEGHTEAAPGSLAAVFSGAAVRRLAGGPTQEMDGSSPATAPNPARPVNEAAPAPPPSPNPGGGGTPGNTGGPLSPLRVALFREAHGSLENIVNGKGGPEGLWLVNALGQDRDGRAGVTDAFESMVTARNGPEKMMKLFDHAASSPDQSVAMATTLRDMAEAAPDRAVGVMLLTMDAQGGTESVSRLFSALTKEPKGAIAFAEFLDVTSKDPNSSRGMWEMMDTLTTPTMEDPARGRRLAGSLARSSEWVQGSQALTRTFGTLLDTDDGGTRFATMMGRLSDTPEGARDTGRLLQNMVFDREGGTQVAKLMARSTQSRSGARHIAETLDRAASTKEGAVAVSRTFLGMAHSKDGARVLANLARDSSTAAPLLSMLHRLEANPAAASRFSRALDQMAADPRVRTEMNIFRGRAAATPELQAALDRVWRPETAASPRQSAPVPLSWGGALAMERAGLAPKRDTSVSSVTSPSAAAGVARSVEAPQGAQAGSGAGQQQGQGDSGSGGRAPAVPTEPGEAPAPPVVRTAAPVTITPTVPVLIDWPAAGEMEAAAVGSAPEAAVTADGTPAVTARLPHPTEEPAAKAPATASDEKKAEAVRRPGDPVALRRDARTADPDPAPAPEGRRAVERGAGVSAVEATSAVQASRTGADIPLFARTDSGTGTTEQKPQSTPFRPGDYYSEDTLRSARICPECGFRTSSAGVCARCVSNAYREGRTQMAVSGARAI